MITPIAAFLLVLSSPAGAQQVQAKLDCKLSDTDFVYDCIIRLKPPKRGVRISVSAEMPSMPMQHDTAPVRATPGKAPGEYRAQLDLEMPGEWAVTLRLSGAARDVLVLNHSFPDR